VTPRDGGVEPDAMPRASGEYREIGVRSLVNHRYLAARPADGITG
jgi:hypothetical protein